MWISRKNLQRLISEAHLDGERQGIRTGREQERAAEFSNDRWLPRSDKDWVMSDPAKAIEKIEAAAKERIAEATRGVEARERRLRDRQAHLDEYVEDQIAERYRHDDRKEDAAYQKGYADGFTAGQRSPRRKTPTEE